MLDIAFIRDNQKQVAESIKQRGLKVDLKRLIEVDDKRRQLIQDSDALRSELKLDSKPNAETLAKAQKTKANYEAKQTELKKAEAEYQQLVYQVPNLIADGTPEGDESKNKVQKTSPKPKLDFKPKDHSTLAAENDWIDFERGAKVAGNKFYYLKGAAVRLEMALMQFAMDQLETTGFTPMMTPHMVNTRVAEGTGFSPRGEEDQEYKIAGEDLRLIATAEVSLTGYHADEILDPKQLPARYAGLSPSYRKEAGAYGKHSKGLFRVHQFDKLEMYVLCVPQDSENWHQKILAQQESICQQLEIPYQVVRNASGDLGAPAYKKFDIQYYSPVDDNYRELTSCSNCTDYQARNLGIRFRNQAGKTEYVHTLNGTALVFSRFFIALLENHQQADGSVKLPAVLHKYYGKGGL